MACIVSLSDTETVRLQTVALVQKVHSLHRTLGDFCDVTRHRCAPQRSFCDVSRRRPVCACVAGYRRVTEARVILTFVSAITIEIVTSRALPFSRYSFGRPAWYPFWDTADLELFIFRTDECTTIHCTTVQL